MISRRRTLKSIHLASTVWFIFCVGFVLVFALRQAGLHWWVIFSLSGHSALVTFILIGLYLFIVFEGAHGSHRTEMEHPLTNTDYYVMFYVAAPLLGGLAGTLGTIGTKVVSQFVLGVALGTLGTTLLVWIIIDPVTVLLETLLLPTSRKLRAERLAQAKAEQEKKQKHRERLLAEVLAREESDRRRRQQILKPQAEKLAGLLASTDFEWAELEAVGIGADAWQIGGLSCMRQLHDMAIEMYRERNRNRAIVDYISVWWDGIGTWRDPSLG